MAGERGAVLVGFFRRQVHQQHAVHAGLGSGGGKTGGTADLDRIQVAHQDHGRGGIGFTESTHRVQHEGQPGTTCQRALGAALDHRAIGHGVGKRHAQFDHVGAGRGQCMHDRHGRFQRRVAGADERHQRLATGRTQRVQPCLQTGHSFAAAAGGTAPAAAT